MNDKPITHDEDPITLEEVNAMPQDERYRRLNAYRELVASGNLMSKTTHTNALLILRQVRHKNVADNPRAKPKAKKKAEVTQALDMNSFLSKDA